MKVLMISGDSKILEEGSTVRERMISYGTICDELHIIVVKRGARNLESKIQISDNTFVYPTTSSNKILALFRVYSVGTYILTQNSKLKTQNWIVTSQDPFETGFFAWLISKKTGSKLELQIHTDFLSPYFAGESFLNKIRVSLAGFLLPKADGIRVVSRRIADSLKTENLKLKTTPTVLPVFVDIEKIRKAEPKIDLHKKYPQFDFIALVISRLAPEKNVGLAILALSEAVKKYPKTGLVIAGSGSERKALEMQVANYKVQNNVVFEGWTDEAVSHYKTADVFLNTSNYEGFGMALVEAAASDCPIISTDVGIAGSVLRDGEEAFVCPIGDATCFYRGLERFIAYPALCKEIALRAETAIEPLSISKEKYLKRMKEIWNGCCVARHVA